MDRDSRRKLKNTGSGGTLLPRVCDPTRAIRLRFLYERYHDPDLVSRIPRPIVRVLTTRYMARRGLAEIT